MEQTPTYLSIDLDYWSEPNADIEEALAFFDKVNALNLPIFVCISHEQLLDQIDKSGAKALINVDFHDDLVNTKEPRWAVLLEEGSWVSFVAWKRKGSYLWILPDETKCVGKGFGRCDKYEPPDPLVRGERKSSSEWKNVEWAEGLNHIPWDDVNIVAVGVCFSPEWTTEPTVRRILWQLCGALEHKWEEPFPLEAKSLKTAKPFPTWFAPPHGNGNDHWRDWEIDIEAERYPER